MMIKLQIFYFLGLLLNLIIVILRSYDYLKRLIVLKAKIYLKKVLKLQAFFRSYIAT